MRFVTASIYDKSAITCFSDANHLFSWQFLKDTVYLEGIKVYECIIKSLSSFGGSYEQWCNGFLNNEAFENLVWYSSLFSVP